MTYEPHQSTSQSISETEFVYSDPSYLQQIRRSGKRLYRHDDTEANHLALLYLLKALPCSVMVSGHPSILCDTLLTGWTRIAQQVTTNACVRTEVIWLNFTPDRVHSFVFAGQNKTERQRIKRNVA